MREIENFYIPGGSGDKLETCYVGSIDDFLEFKNSLYSGLYGYVEESDNYTLDGYEGFFFDLYTNAYKTVKVNNIDDPDFDEMDPDEYTYDELVNIVLEKAREEQMFTKFCIWCDKINFNEVYFGIFKEIDDKIDIEKE